jgi:hypothetical protein
VAPTGLGVTARGHDAEGSSPGRPRCEGTTRGVAQHRPSTARGHNATPTDLGTMVQHGPARRCDRPSACMRPQERRSLSLALYITLVCKCFHTIRC